MKKVLFDGYLYWYDFVFGWRRQTPEAEIIMRENIDHAGFSIGYGPEDVKEEEVPVGIRKTVGLINNLPELLP